MCDAWPVTGVIDVPGGPLTLRVPALTVTVAPPATIGITLRPVPRIDVAWPRVRVTQARLPARPSTIVLPARSPQGWQRLGRVRIWSPPPAAKDVTRA
jgi:hypothetical protein